MAGFENVAISRVFSWDFVVTMIRARDLDQEVCDQRSRPALGQRLSLRVGKIGQEKSSAVAKMTGTLRLSTINTYLTSQIDSWLFESPDFP